MVLELTFQRASVHPVHDAKRLEDGKDLNDALLDFFVKLGQELLPKGSSSVAYLGSHFYDVLRKGGAKNGYEGHKNVSNWARRRFGKDGLFSDDIGALAVPVNEVLRESYEGRTDQEEKHWWLCVILNPKAGTINDDKEDVALLCLDSFVRADTQYDPPIRALKAGNLVGYPVEVTGLSRIGFQVNVLFRAQGDGTKGPLSEPRKSRMKAGGREFGIIETNLKVKERGGDGMPGRIEGSLGFRLDRRGAAKTGGEYTLEFGEIGDNYQPPLRLRMGQKPTSFQAQVANFLGGYLIREKEVHHEGGKENGRRHKATRVEETILLPGIPQQETSHDCGFFMLEQILRLLQLSSKSLRELASATSFEIAMLPWPSQKQVFSRKAKLRESMSALFAAARQYGTGDVAALLKKDASLRDQLRSALREGCPSFQKGFDRWAAGDWDLSPSPYNDKSDDERKRATKGRSRGRSDSDSERRDRRKKRKRRGSSSDSRDYKRKRRDTSSSRSRSESRAAEKLPEPKEPERPSFTMADLEALPTSKVRAHCVTYGVLPVGPVERGDLIQALAPFAKAAPAPTPRVFTPAEPVRTSQPTQPRPAAVPTANHAFTRKDLEGMTSKAGCCARCKKCCELGVAGAVHSAWGTAERLRGAR